MNDTFEMGSILMFIYMLLHHIFLYTSFVILKFNSLLGVFELSHFYPCTYAHCGQRSRRINDFFLALLVDQLRYVK